MAELLSILEMAKANNEPPSRISYVIRKFSIEPKRTVGSTRMFDEAGQTRIKQALYGIRIQK